MAELKVQFLDVGQGDGIFIEFPGGATMLVDLGSTKNGGITNPDILTYFKDHTKFGNLGETLDYLVLTHGDRDHYNMVKEFITDRQVNVAKILFGGKAEDYTSGFPERGSKSKAKNLIERIKELCPGVTIVSPEDLPLKLPSPTGNATFGEADVYLLMVNAPGPSHSDNAWRKNTNSVVLLLHYRAAKIILAGDATTDTESMIYGVLMQKFGKDRLKVINYLSSHVLKLGHHGSRRTSNHVAWIQSVYPRFVFISSDRHGALDEKSKSGHRLPQTLTLDLIINHSGHLYNQCEAHNVISAFDPADYTNYNKKPDLPDDKVTPDGMKKEWRQTNTKLGLFTSLVEMDASREDESPADRGAQFQLSVSDQGMVEITSTYEPRRVVPPISVLYL